MIPVREWLYSILKYFVFKSFLDLNFTRKTPIQVFSCKLCKILQSNVIREMVGSEAVARRWSVKNLFIKILQNSQENTCVSLYLNKVEETPTQVFSVNFAQFLRIPFS